MVLPSNINDKDEMQELANKYRGGDAEQLLNLIIGLYFQSQQRSYLVNHFKRQNPLDQIREDGSVLVDDPIHEAGEAEEWLCQYEKDRVARLQKNREKLRELGLI